MEETKRKVRDLVLGDCRKHIEAKVYPGIATAETFSLLHGWGVSWDMMGDIEERVFLPGMEFSIRLEFTIQRSEDNID
jgi:hypothetical protein